MDKLLSDLWTLVLAQVDVLLVLGVVLVVQLLKARAFPKMPKKLWALVMLALAAVAAWIATPTGHGQDYANAIVRRWIVYAGGAELVYQMWRTVLDYLRARLTKK